MQASVGGYVMAFDFGLRHIGVAIGQTITGTANGVATISANQGRPDWRQLNKLLQEYKPVHLVVGLPLNMDGSHSDMAGAAQEFANALQQRFGLAVDLHDERLSSRAAKASFEEAKDLGQANTEHELAACLILRSWLSAQG